MSTLHHHRHLKDWIQANGETQTCAFCGTEMAVGVGRSAVAYQLSAKRATHRQYGVLGNLSVVGLIDTRGYRPCYSVSRTIWACSRTCLGS